MLPYKAFKSILLIIASFKDKLGIICQKDVWSEFSPAFVALRNTFSFHSYMVKLDIQISFFIDFIALMTL